MSNIIRNRIRAVKSIIIGVTVSSFALYFAFRDVQWSSLYNDISAFNPINACLCVVMIALSLQFRGLRWAMLSNRSSRGLWGFHTRAVVLGTLANLILPMRAGEVVRIFAIKRISSCSLTKAILSALFDRLTDVIVLALCAAFIVFRVSDTYIPKTWFLILSIVTGGFFVTFLILRNQSIRNTLNFLLVRLLSRWAIKIDSARGTLHELVDNLQVPRKKISLIGVIACVLLVDYAGVMAGMAAVGITLPWEAALMVWVLFAAGSAVPSAPGYVGIYQAAAVWGLGFYNVSPSQAILFAFVFQAITLLTTTLLSLPDICTGSLKLFNRAKSPETH